MALLETLLGVLAGGAISTITQVVTSTLAHRRDRDARNRRELLDAYSAWSTAFGDYLATLEYALLTQQERSDLAARQPGIQMQSWLLSAAPDLEGEARNRAVQIAWASQHAASRRVLLLEPDAEVRGIVDQLVYDHGPADAEAEEGEWIDAMRKHAKSLRARFDALLDRLVAANRFAR